MTVADPDPDFDTLAVARDLEASGIGKEPAEAVARTIRQGRAGLTTKADLDTGLDNLESRMQATLYRALWMQTGAIVGTIVAAAGVVVAAVALL